MSAPCPTPPVRGARTGLVVGNQGGARPCFLFLFLRSLDWRRDQIRADQDQRAPASTSTPQGGGGGAWSVEPLPESDKNAARNRARDELSLAWDETLANNPMTPRTRPHRLRWWFLWFLQATESGTQPAPSYLPFSSVPPPSPHASVKVLPIPHCCQKQGQAQARLGDGILVGLQRREGLPVRLPSIGRILISLCRV